MTGLEEDYYAGGNEDKVVEVDTDVDSYSDVVQLILRSEDLLVTETSLATLHGHLSPFFVTPNYGDFARTEQVGLVLRPSVELLGSCGVSVCFHFISGYVRCECARPLQRTGWSPISSRLGSCLEVCPLALVPRGNPLLARECA